MPITNIVVIKKPITAIGMPMILELVKHKQNDIENLVFSETR